jgi:hypothetical protein
LRGEVIGLRHKVFNRSTFPIGNTGRSPYLVPDTAYLLFSFEGSTRHQMQAENFLKFFEAKIRFLDRDKYSKKYLSRSKKNISKPQKVSFVQCFLPAFGAWYYLQKKVPNTGVFRYVSQFRNYDLFFLYKLHR